MASLHRLSAGTATSDTAGSQTGDREDDERYDLVLKPHIQVGPERLSDAIESL